MPLKSLALEWILLALVGCCFGSFGSVLYSRLITKQSWGTGRSQCLSCSRRLNVADLIPVISYLVTKGRCRYCNQSYGSYHLYFEIITGLLFLLVYLRWGISIQVLGYLAIATMTSPLTYYDIKFLRIPISWTNFCIYVQLFLWFIVSFQNDNPNTIQPSMIAFSLCFIFYFLLYQLTGRTGIGWGDVKLAPPLIGMSALLEPGRGVVAFFTSLMIPGLLAITLLALNKVDRKTQIPLGPFLILGFWIAVLAPENIINLFEKLWSF